MKYRVQMINLFIITFSRARLTKKVENIFHFYFI